MSSVSATISMLSHVFTSLDSPFSNFSLHVWTTVGMTNSFFWFGRTCSTLIGQYVVEHLGHANALFGALIISFVPIIIFGLFMPETLNTRGNNSEPEDNISLTGTDEKITNDQARNTRNSDRAHTLNYFWLRYAGKQKL